MPNYLHRTTLDYRVSVSPVELEEPETNYIKDPDLSVVGTFPNQYWTITGDIVTLKTPSERDVVDAVAVETARDSAVTVMDRTENLLRALALTILDEVNVLRSQHGLAPRTAAQLRTGIRNKLGN